MFCGKGENPSRRRSVIRLERAILDRPQLALEPVLSHGDRQIASGLLENAPGNVGGTTQATGHPVWVVDGDENIVDVVHCLEQGVACRQFVAAQTIHQKSPEFSDCLAESVQVGRQSTPTSSGPGSGSPRRTVRTVDASANSF